MLPLNKLLTGLLSVAALCLSIPALAASCSMTTSDAAELGDMYVVSDVCQPDCLFSVMVYEETNGMAGLQRSDVHHDDTCNGRAGAADERVF